MVLLHGITLKMATVVNGQASGSLRGISGWRSHGNRREEMGERKTPLCGELWGMTGESAFGQEMLAFVYVSQLIRKTDYAALVSK